MKFAAVVLVLLATLFASVTHGMAAAAACVEMRAVESPANADGIDAAGLDDASTSPDDAHCGFGMMASHRPEIGRATAPSPASAVMPPIYSSAGTACQTSVLRT